MASSTVLSVTFPEACSLPLPGGRIGPSTRITSGVAISDATTQMVVKRRAWFGSSAVSLDDIDEPIHVAERLHRPPEAVDVAGSAGDEALPAVAPLLACAEAEGDRAVGSTFTRREFALVLGFFSDTRQRDEHAELGHHERVRGFFGVDRVGRLAVDRLGSADRALDLREERVAQAAV